jgi:Cytidine and deoxycytidylate deaminase zinc-binding region
MKQKFLEYFMDVAERTAQLSYAEKLKVGCVIVKDGRILTSALKWSRGNKTYIYSINLFREDKMSDWITCGVCEEEYKVISSDDELVSFCPFCGAEIELEDEYEDEDFEDE